MPDFRSHGLADRPGRAAGPERAPPEGNWGGMADHMADWAAAMRAGDHAAAWAISERELQRRDPARRDDQALPSRSEGRSVRERVWPYVQISVVAVALTKKKTPKNK